MSEPDFPSQIGGRYRPIRLIGKGGMGAVYEVEHLHTGQRLAMKVLTPQPGASVDRFKREARAASRIRSDHIVQVTDADVAAEFGGAPFLVMELLEGSDLEGVTGKNPASPEDVIGWLRQVARALAKAHDAGIIHRDLKPENLFLTRREDGSPLVKILDFGIAKIVTEGSTLTQSGALLGTPAYMAPEQTESSGPPISRRADLYALGLIAFKFLTGRSYWRNGSLAQLLAQILAEPMPPASERGSCHGPAFDAWFRRACDRDPGKRFASAIEQVEALAAALGLPQQAHVVSAPAPRMPTTTSPPNAASAGEGHAQGSRHREADAPRRGPPAFTVECHVGRLVETCPRALNTLEDVEAFSQAMGALAVLLPGRIAICGDYRFVSVLSQRVADAVVAMMSRTNPKIDRSAVLLSAAHATFNLQIERVIRDASNPARRSFRDAAPLKEWLGEILTPPEQARLASFVSA